MTFTSVNCSRPSVDKAACTLKFRADLEPEIQKRSAAADAADKKFYLDTKAAQEHRAIVLTPRFLKHALKGAVAQSIIYHHQNGSATLQQVLCRTAPSLGGKGGPTSHGVGKVYFDTVLDDIDGIVDSYGAEEAMKSVRALPLWCVAPKPAIEEF